MSEENAAPGSRQETKELPKPPVPFRVKLSVLGALLAVIPLLVVGWMLLDVNRNTVLTNAHELQLAVADDLAGAIDNGFTEAQDGLNTIGRVLTDATLPADQTETLVLAQVAGNEAIDHAAIYGADGGLREVIFEENTVRPHLPDSLPEDVRQRADESEIATGQASTGSDAPRVLVVLPLRVRDQVSGYVATQLSMAPLGRRVARLNEVRFGDRPDSVFVIDESHRLLAHPDMERAAALESVAGEGMLARIDPGVISRRFQQSGEYQAPNGQDMVGTVVGLQTRPWAVVAQAPEEIVYASLLRMRKIVLITLAIVTVLALLLALFIARQVTQPIEELSEFATALANRKFERRVTLNTRDEFSVLGDVMSAAAADLQESEERIRTEEAIRADLGRYLPSEVVEAVVRREQDMGLGGERKNITILFADVVAFTPITDTLSAEEVVGLLNELFTILTEIVFRHGGTIDKFIGDCVMAMWGAPSEQPDHASLALAAAEDMIRWLEAGNAGWLEKYGAKIELAIGVNSGDAIVGNIGSETRMEFTAIGDTVNVAARLESIARPGQILVTKSTQELIDPDDYELEDLGDRNLSGREAPVHLYELVV